MYKFLYYNDNILTTILVDSILKKSDCEIYFYSNDINIKHIFSKKCYIIFGNNYHIFKNCYIITTPFSASESIINVYYNDMYIENCRKLKINKLLKTNY